MDGPRLISSGEQSPKRKVIPECGANALEVLPPESANRLDNCFPTRRPQTSARAGNLDGRNLRAIDNRSIRQPTFFTFDNHDKGIWFGWNRPGNRRDHSGRAETIADIVLNNNRRSQSSLFATRDGIKLDPIDLAPRNSHHFPRRLPPPQQTRWPLQTLGLPTRNSDSPLQPGVPFPARALR